MAYIEAPFMRDHGDYYDQLDYLQPLTEILSDHALDPQGGDTRITACMVAVHQKIHDPDEQEFRTHLIDYLVNPQAAGYGEPKHAAMKLVRAIQSQLLKPDNRRAWDYPRSFKDPEQWDRAIDWIMDDEMKKLAFAYDLFQRRVSSNKPQRYVSIPILTGMRREIDGRFSEPLRVLDLGCSLNMGLGKLASGSPFSPVEVVKSFVDNPDEDEEVDEATTEQFNRYAREYELEEGVGVDIALLDRQGKWWAMSNSGYPSEWLDEALEAEFEYIHEAEDRPNVRRLQANIADFDSMTSLDLEPGSFDVVSVLTTAYEMSARERMNTWRIADYFAKKDALIISSEFAATTRLGSLVAYKNMFDKPGKYRTAVKDRAMPFARKSPELRWRNGRCKSVVLDSGALALQKAISEQSA